MTAHSLEKKEQKDPTCENAGNSTYWECETCHKYFEDKNGEKEIGPGEYMEVRMVETEEGLTLQFTPRGEESNK